MNFLIVEGCETTALGIAEVLKKEYSANGQTILHAKTVSEAASLLWKKSYSPKIIITEIFISKNSESPPENAVGIEWIGELLTRFPEGNIVIYTYNLQVLIRLNTQIDIHRGGFSIVCKGEPIQNFTSKINWALEGIIYKPKNLRSDLDLKPELITLLRLAFIEGMQDKAIAENMNIAERTVRYYWTQIQDALQVYPETGKNIRIQVEIQARQEGLLD